MKRFVVSSEKTLASVLTTLGIPPVWVDEGRVFVGAVRAKDRAHPLHAGDEIRIEEPHAPHAQNAQTATKLPPILFEDAHLCVVHKPAGISTIGDQKSEADSLRGLVAAYRKCDPESVHATSRLDRLVSGVVTFAMSKKARDDLAAAREAGTYHRRYFAIGRAPAVEKEVGDVWDAPIGRAKNPRLRMIRGKNATDAKSLVKVVASTTEAVLLALEPQTGRTHQLRLHAAHAGMPLFGDKDYGGKTHHTDTQGRVFAIERIALHAAAIRFPYRGSVLGLDAPVDDALLALWKCLGGADEAWNTAWTCSISREP